VSGLQELRSIEVIRLVAGREIGQRLRAKSFYVGTGVLVLVILAVGVISRLAGGDPPAAIDIAVVAAESDEIVAAMEGSAAAFGRTAEVTFFDDAAAANAAVDDGTVDVAVVVDDLSAVFGEEVDQEVLAVVQQAWALVDVRERLADAGLTSDEIADALSVTPLAPVTLGGDDRSTELEMLTGTLAAVLLLISLQTFGTYVLTGVVEEKSSAVVEVLLVRARADQMLAGKVIGIGVAALAQFASAVAAGLGSLAISGVSVPGAIWSAVPMTLVWFLGGFALYATLFALAGSLVSRQEDAQAAAAPIMYSLVAAYMLVFVLGFEPESTASMVASLVPPIAPLLMPVRMAAGAASTGEVVLALVLLCAATFAVWKLASRIYEQVLLQRGARISWRKAWVLLRGGHGDEAAAQAR